MLRTTSFPLVLLGLACPAWANVTFYYNDRPGFDAAVAGMTLVCTETFEELGIPPGSLVCYPFPPGLQGPPGAGNINCPMAVYSSYFDPSCDIVGLGAGFIGNPTTVVGANYFAASTEYDFGAAPGPEVPEGPNYGGYWAVGFEFFDPIAPGVYPINVFDMNNNLIGTTNVHYPGQFAAFMGIVVDQTQGPIGRVELASTGGDLTDNWELYIPEPSALALLALGGLLLRRR